MRTVLLLACFALAALAQYGNAPPPQKTYGQNYNKIDVPVYENPPQHQFLRKGYDYSRSSSSSDSSSSDSSTDSDSDSSSSSGSSSSSSSHHSHSYEGY